MITAGVDARFVPQFVGSAAVICAQSAEARAFVLARDIVPAFARSSLSKKRLWIHERPVCSVLTRIARRRRCEDEMQNAARFEKPEELFAAVGRQIYLSDWVVVDQARIDKFADASGDFQWIHVDVERAKKSPFGGTIAHGFLTLSLLGGLYEPYLQYALPFCDMGLNYGLNRVRFTAPVPAGRRVRARLVLTKAEAVQDGLGLQLTSAITVEIEGQEKPALVAESVVRRYFRKEGAR